MARQKLQTKVMDSLGPDHKNSLSALDGLSLAEAFKAFLAESPDVQASIEAARPSEPNLDFSNDALFGWLGKRTSLSIDAIEKADQFCAPQTREEWAARFSNRPERIPLGTSSSQTEDEVPQAFRQLAEAVFTRYCTFVTLLVSGELSAVGFPPNGPAVTVVPSSLWSSRELKINWQENELSNGSGRKRQIAFRAIEIRLPRSHNAASADVRSKTNRGGRESKYLWEEAFEVLVVNLGEHGHPDNGARLAEMYLDAFTKLGADDPGISQARRHLRTHYPKLWQHVTMPAER